jgi:hypothetical protein
MALLIVSNGLALITHDLHLDIINVMDIVLTLLHGILVLLFESLKTSNVKHVIFGATPLKNAQVWPRLH